MGDIKWRCHISVVLWLMILSTSVSGEKWTANSTTDSCFEGRGEIFPCSSTIVGNLILMVFYGGLLGCAAKFISDGAEMLLDFGFPPSVIGGVVLPVLGAVPDCGIIVASGMGDDAQEKLSVGMGTLAGSTVMLLTIAWTASLMVGRCDLDETNTSIDQTLKGPFSLSNQGVTLLRDVRSGITLMMVTSLLYFVVQGADWYWGATLIGPQPAYVSTCALVTMVMCLLGFIGYIIFSIFDSQRNERMVRLHKQELLKRKVIHTMLTSSFGLGPKTPTKVDGEADAPASGPLVAKKYFKAWNIKTGSKDIKEKLALIKDDNDDSNGERSADYGSTSPDVEATKDDDKTNSARWDKVKEVVKCITLLVGGVGMVTVFSDPMCDVLTSLTNDKNKSYIPIPSFYVSFVVTPFCSNASELVSSLIFAAKKTRENTTMTYSQLFGAATMNNTLCLAIFMALVYFKDLEWIYGAEVVCIIAAQWIVGAISYARTYKVWMGVPVGLTYVFCIMLVWVLEFKAGWH